MDDTQILDGITDRYMEEAGEDIHYALRLLAYDFHRLGGMVSTGYSRVAPVAVSGLPPKVRVKPIDIPQPGAPQARNPGA